MDKTFEKQFPSLKEKGMALELHIHNPNDGKCTTEHYHWDKTKFGNIFFGATEIENHCIDKQKVRDAIEWFETLLYKTGEMSKEDRAKLTRKFDMLKERLEL